MNTTITKIIVYDNFAHYKDPATGRMMEVETTYYNPTQHRTDGIEETCHNLGAELYDFANAVPVNPTSFGRSEDYTTMCELLEIAKEQR